MRFILIGCLLAVFARAQEQLDLHALLNRIGQAVGENISRSDNYICAEDLSRFYFQPPAGRSCRATLDLNGDQPIVEDRLKLDVAVSQAAEIYSWHGEHKFSASDVSQLIQHGPISSGSFNGYLRNIFGEPKVRFIYRGESKGVYTFDYSVPLEASHYRLQAAGSDTVLAPFHGSFTADVGNFQLHSLSVIADDLAGTAAEICIAQTKVDYREVTIGKHESLLPATFDLAISTKTGVVTDSKGRYSECREYAGESTVHFDMDDAAGGGVGPAVAAEQLKKGVYLPVTFRGLPEEESAFAGMPVEGVLSRNVKAGKDVVLPRGSVVKGTLTKFQIVHQPEHTVQFAIEFNSVTTAQGKQYLCKAIRYVNTTFQPSYKLSGRERGRMGPPSLAPTGGVSGEDASLFETAHLRSKQSFDEVFITVDP